MHCTPRHSISDTKDLQTIFSNARVSFASSPTTGSLQFLNVRLAKRLYRYRLLKRQWNDLATATQNDSSHETLVPMSSNTSSSQESKASDTNGSCTLLDKATMKENRKKIAAELQPMQSQIQHDLFQLSGLIRERQKKFAESFSLKTNAKTRPSKEITLLCARKDNTTTIKKSASLYRIKPLDCVQISGCQMHSVVLPQHDLSDSGLGTASNSSSNCSQYSKQVRKIKQQSNHKMPNIYRTRVTESLPCDPFILGIPPPKLTLNAQAKIIQNTPLKQTQSFCLPTPLKTKTISINQVKHESPSPASDIEQTTTCSYAYVASTSSSIPQSMKLIRNTSLLSILLTSSSCLGNPSSETHLEQQKENNTNCHNLLDYHKLLNHLPKPLISIHSRHDRDGYGILFAQLDHIRETMPNYNVYNDYTRLC